jgi:uncharacterized protein YdeI (YjbR/CyaY-like superfamily)
LTATKAANHDLPILLFETLHDWTTWLEANHASATGVWVRMAKKASGIPAIDYNQAVEGALCYGWIDGIKKSYDETSWLQKFTPRGPKSIWSKINREKVQALIERGQMRPAGMRAVEAAQADGRWQAAYDSQRNATIPDDFQAALDGSAEASRFFATLNSANRYAFLFRIHQAKRAETRAKRIQDYIAMLERHEKFHP